MFVSDVHEQVRATCRSLADDVLRPRAAHHDRERVFPREQFARLAALGIAGCSVCEEYGGAALDKLAYAIAVEEVSRGCAATGAILSVHSLYCAAVETFGMPEQKLRFLQPFARGEQIGCFALSEPHAGSDAAALAMRARSNGSRWLLDGCKAWVTNAEQAGAAVVFARTGDSAHHECISAFLVPLPTPGVTIGRREETMGIRACSHAQLRFENVAVPHTSLLGELGQGFRIAMGALDVGRIGMAAQAVGIGQAAFDAALAYAKERTAFGAPISAMQAIQFKLADMAARLQAARLLTMQAAVACDRGEPVTMASAMAKLVASEAATFVAHQAMQIFGGNGYSTEFPVERHYRDARVTEIYEGTSEVLRGVIATRILRAPSA